MSEIIGYIASVLIGVSLGLIGSGGSILTVPVLVYLFGVDAALATAYSLFIVCATSAVGSVDYLRKGLVSLRTAIVFGTPSIIAVFLTRTYLVPAIPNEIVTICNIAFTKSLMMLFLFAVLMVLASFSMIRKQKRIIVVTSSTQKFNYPMILLEGAIVGTITGLVGAGGGFLIIPALVLLSNLPMKKAVGTSLLIIAVNSLIGFFGVSTEAAINWQLLGGVSAVATVGIFIGTFLAKKIDGEKLKPAFGYFVLSMGLYIITKELFFR